MNNERIFKAILVAPLSAYPAFVVYMALLQPSMAVVALTFGLFALPVSYFGMIIIGIPSIALLVYLHATRWWHLTLAGAFGGACMWCASGEEIMSLGSAYAAAFGVVVAGTTWYIAFRRLSPTTDPTADGEV